MKKPTDETVVVHRSFNDIEAQAICDLLEQNGILTVSGGQFPHSVLPLTMNGLGETKIQVCKENESRAKELIAAFLTEAEEEG